MSEVSALADEFVEVLFDAEPVTPALQGFRPESTGLTDLSEAAGDAFRAKLAGLAERAEALGTDGLSAEEKTTRDVLIASARAKIALLDSRFVEFTISDLFISPAAEVLTVLPMMSVGTGAQAEAHLGRIAAIPEFLRQAAQRHRDGVARGLVPVAYLVDSTVEYLDRHLADPSADPLLRQPAPDDDFETRRADLLRDVVRPAIAEYREVLAKEIAPHGRPEDKPGVCWLPDGERIYALLAEMHTTTVRTPRELHQTGLDVIANLAAEYREYGSSVFGTTDLAEIFSKLRTDPALRWSNADEMLDSARAAITRAEAEAPKWFGRIPPQPWKVEAVPAESAPGAPAAYYMWPAIDGSRPGIYFANTHKAEERFRHAAEATAFHEAIPGHHFQLSLAQGLSELPLLRRIGDFNAYAEGWGLYTERLADEMGLYSDDVAKLGMLTMDSMRAGRLVVDTGLHALGWSRRQAIDFLTENTPMALVEIESEVDRYIAFPGQALSYMVGRLEIQRIREEAELTLGGRFDIKAFHDVVLGGGSLPLSVLDGVVRDWVAGHGDTPNSLAGELMELKFEEYPLWRSLLGLPGHDGSLPDPSAEAVAVQRASAAAIAERAEALAVEGLSATEAVTREVVIQQAKAMIDLADSRSADISVSDGLASPALSVLNELAMLALTDEERVRGYLERLEGLGSYLDTLIVRQRAAAAEGLVPPGFLVESGVAYVERYLGDEAGDPLALTASVSVEGYETERDRLLAEVVRPAYRRYRDFLDGELRPLAKPEEEPGLCALPGGQEKYAALIRAHTSTERTAQDLHDTGLDMIAKLAGQYRELGEKIFDTQDLGEIFERLRTDPALRWRDGDELLDAARDAIARAEAVAPQWFSTIPEEKCQVEPVPPAEAPGGTLAYYLEAALDGSRPGTYYANTHEADQRPKHTSEAIAFHEAVPGHHFQICIAHHLKGLPMLRSHADVNAYVEGWGLYSERLADEMGLYSSELTRFGMLTQDSMRAGRLVVDTGMHALGWSRQRAVDYLVENTPMARVEIEAEIDRYAAYPGQALSYMVGRLEIERIRAEAETALGDRFDIKGFHEVVLSNGILPLRVLDNVVKEWVAAHK
ncbi:DUF885 domain-containing protein [Amycolatopsis sp. lyj-90]|uniref:DUF885 domain-containing protein n=1 Tax=Amycolatopsis sp. lyj-90 TaxID=2789285 RepID=UPI00397B59ED